MIALIRNGLAGLLRPEAEISPERMEAGSRWLMVHGVGIMTMVALQGGPFLPAFVLALGGGSGEVGLLATIALVTQAMQIPGLLLLQHLPRRRLLVVISTLLYRLGWLCIAAIPLIRPTGGLTLFLLLLLATELVGALSGPAWNSLMGEIVPENRRGDVFSTRLMLGTVSGLVFTLLGGWAVDRWKLVHPDQALMAYSALFVLGILFGLLGTYAVTRLPETRMVHNESASLVELLRRPLADDNFRRLLVFVAVWAFAINLSGPFFIVYMMKQLELPLFLVTLLTVCNQVANLAFLRIWGRLADRFSNKSVLAVSSPLFLVAVLGWTFTTLPDKHAFTVPLLFAIQLLGGMSLAGVSIASANIALKLSPRGMAHAYVTVHGIVGAVAGSIAPILGGIMASSFAGRELAVTLSWTDPNRKVLVPAMNLNSLDFLFFVAVLVGFYALHRLALVREEGEVEERAVRQQLLAEMAAPFRMVAAVSGLRHLVTIPISAIHRLGGLTRPSPGKPVPGLNEEVLEAEREIDAEGGSREPPSPHDHG